MFFLECYDEKTRDQMIKNGHELMLTREASEGNKIWVFKNNPKNLNFSNIDETKIKKSSKMFF